MFSDDVLKGKHNSEAIEVAPGTLVVVRVAEHKPAAQKPLEEVAASIRQTLTDSKAAELASEKGKTLLATLKAGKAAAGESWGPMQTVSRQAPVSLSRTLHAWCSLPRWPNCRPMPAPARIPVTM
ncbi:MAG: hypothetical protein U1E47_04310 [Rivihabitans pingtungensis]